MLDEKKEIDMKAKQQVTHGPIAKRRSRWVAILAACAAAAVLTTGCSDQTPEQTTAARGAGTLSGTVRVAGSATIAPMIAEIATAFQKIHPAVEIEVRGVGSGRGVKDVKEGKADIGMVSKVIPVEEHELVPFLIARDGVGIAVHSDNPVKTITEEQIRDIYTKKITSWRVVGGDDAAPYVIGASSDAGSTDLFLSHFRVALAQMQADFHGIPKERFAALAKNPAAILYVSLADAERRAAAGEKVKLLPIDGIAATSDNLAAGRYPLARPLALVTKGMPAGAVKSFLEYAQSPAAAAIIDRYEFVPYRD